MPDRPIVLMMTSMHESGMQLLRDFGTVRMAPALDPQTLRREVRDVDAIVIRTQGDIDPPLLDCAGRLKVIGRHGVGFYQIDIEAATERGILVLNTPGANTEAVCEHTIGMLIGVSKQFP